MHKILDCLTGFLLYDFVSLSFRFAGHVPQSPESVTLPILSILFKHTKSCLGSFVTSLSIKLHSLKGGYYYLYSSIYSVRKFQYCDKIMQAHSNSQIFYYKSRFLHTNELSIGEKPTHKTGLSRKSQAELDLSFTRDNQSKIYPIYT